MMFYKKIFSRVLVFIIITGVLFTGCSGSTTDKLQQNVTAGKRVFADENGNVYFGFNNLICTAAIEDSKIINRRPMIVTESTIHSLAAHDGYLYILARNGIFRYPLSAITADKNSGNANDSENKNGNENTNENTDTYENPEVLLREQFDAPAYFEIFEDNIYFAIGNTLYSVPVTGGNKTEVKDDVRDFEVTNKGICFAKNDGKLFLISTNLSNEKELGQLPKGAGFTIGGANLYYTNEGIIESFSIDKKTSSDTGNAKEAAKEYVPWSDGNFILYADNHLECRLITSEEEQSIGRVPAYPDKQEGCISGNLLISISSDSKRMQVIDFNKAEVTLYELGNMFN